MAKRKKKIPRDKFSVAMRSLCRYMETQGWKMVVAGGIKVEGWGKGKFGRYRLIVDFTGGKLAAEPSQPEGMERSK